MEVQPISTKKKGRGPNKTKKAKSYEKTNSGTFGLKNEAKALHNAKRQIKYRNNKIKAMRTEMDDMRERLESVVNSSLPSQMQISLASKVVREQVLNPTNIMIAQLEQVKGSLTFSSLETLRTMLVQRPYARSFLPSRATLQRAHLHLFLAGEQLLNVVNDDEEDLFTFSTSTVIEDLIDHWGAEGRVADEDGRCDLDGMTPLQLDATADGAQLTPTQSIVIQGVKILNRDIVQRLTGGSKGTRAATGTGDCNTGKFARPIMYCIFRSDDTYNCTDVVLHRCGPVHPVCGAHGICSRQ
jgi:hypothetical protein